MKEFEQKQRGKWKKELYFFKKKYARTEEDSREERKCYKEMKSRGKLGDF